MAVGMMLGRMGLRVGSLMVWVFLLAAIDGFGWRSLTGVGCGLMVVIGFDCFHWVLIVAVGFDGKKNG